MSSEQYSRVRQFIEVGQAAGAALACKSERPSGPELARGFFLKPAIFTGVEPQMQIAREEILGPVLSVITFDDDAAAVAIANDVAYGLAATVRTTRLDRALQLTDKLEAGIVWVNCCHHLRANVPYDGWKQSGMGEDLGLEAITTLSKLKVSYINYSGERLAW